MTFILAHNHYFYSFKDFLSSWVNPYRDLETQIQEIAAKSLLSPEDKNVLKRTYNLAHQWTWKARNIKNLLKTIPKEHVEELINEILQHESEHQISQKLQWYLESLDQSSLIDLSDLKTAQKAQSWFHSRGLIKHSVLKNDFEDEGKTIFREFQIEAKYFFHHIMELLIGLLGINELGSGKHSRFSDDQIDNYTALHKFESYARLIGLPAILFGIIHAYVKQKVLAIGITALATISIIIILIAYQRYWKPCPKDHFGLKNLNLKILRSKDPLFVRQDILSAIERAFKEKKGVILVGEPGAGKSSIPQSLTEQIADGKYCTFIKDPQIFTCGASTFKNRSFDSPSLDSLSDRFQKFRDQVIFFFDEFHGFFKPDGLQGTSKVDDIKMFCEDFKFVIGATTTKEYQQHIKNQTAIIDRRFIVVKVRKLEDKRIKIILSQYLQVKHPTINLDAQILDYIVQKAPTFNHNTSKIDASLSLLTSAIKEFEIMEFKSLELKIENLETEKNLLEQDLLHEKIGEGDDLVKNLEDKQEKIENLKFQLDKKNKQAERIKKIETYFLELKRESFHMADPKIQLSSDPSLERKWLELQTKIKIVGNFIKNERAKLSLPTSLNRKLIDKIIKKKNKP